MGPNAQMGTNVFAILKKTQAQDGKMRTASAETSKNTCAALRRVYDRALSIYAFLT